jgi:hypothetical protein
MVSKTTSRRIIRVCLQLQPVPPPSREKEKVPASPVGGPEYRHLLPRFPGNPEQERIDTPANPSWSPHPKNVAKTWRVGNRSPTEADDRKLSFRVLMMHSDKLPMTDRSRTCSFPLGLLRGEDPASGIRVDPSGSLRDSTEARSWTSPFWFSFQQPSRRKTGEWSTGAGRPTAQADHSNPEKARRFSGAKNRNDSLPNRSPMRRSPFKRRRKRLARGQRTVPTCQSGGFSPTRRWPLPKEQLRTGRSETVNQAVKDPGATLLSWGFGPFSALVRKSDPHRACLTRLCCTPRLSQPLSALFLSWPSRPCFMPVALLGFWTLQSFPLLKIRSPFGFPSRHDVTTCLSPRPKSQRLNQHY